MHFRSPAPFQLNRTLRPLLLALMTIALALTAAGCGEKEEMTVDEPKQDRLVLLLDWHVNPDHAGIFTGLENGRFEDVGVGLETQVPSDPAAVIKQVAAGRADLGISYANEVLAARDAGAKITAIGSIVPRPLNSIMWLKSSGIKNLKGLKGKHVGTSGAYTSAFLKTILEQNGVDPGSVKETNVGYDLKPALIGRKVDAILGAYWNIEAVELNVSGRPVKVVPVDQAGAPAFDELVVIAADDRLKDTRRTEIYRRFLAGLERGTGDAVKDPKAAAAALIAEDDTLAKRRDEIDASLEKTLPVLAQEERGDNPFGYLDPTRWRDFANWMRDNELLERAPDVEAAYTNDFLPGQGPR